MKHLGIETLSKEDQREIVEGLTENILRGITIAILLRIPKEKHVRFRKLREAGDNEALTLFLQSYIPNLEAIIEEETKRIVEEFRGVVTSLEHRQLPA
ncbi:MAG: hypothetical protein COV10_03780 [Candidatus Vogelbacteria bacterium CG10_big_fil_rev_8_21_14_0_10_51_16]|uniref:Uncharacterized protein n=1 Tax=Candidatus Vogelbacteria bacterium CG10_big_fil_rev_8_21_14_0_10_51_16 TaxID=1975045 RepID=A0A2H0RDY4_9BACT|nr:MAG: hypothetical protein COV10_03780 [Candidatus Vogelbacteria bacterium CG10_big_fil_rev_8_21_14_0_10_51_16]